MLPYLLHPSGGFRRGSRASAPCLFDQSKFGRCWSVIGVILTTEICGHEPYSLETDRGVNSTTDITGLTERCVGHYTDSSSGTFDVPIKKPLYRCFWRDPSQTTSPVGEAVP